MFGRQDHDFSGTVQNLMVETLLVQENVLSRLIDVARVMSSDVIDGAADADADFRSRR